MARDVPARTLETVKELKAASWQELEPGLRVLRISPRAGQVVTAFGISPERFVFSIALQNRPEGERVSSAGERTGAVIAVNAGFFGINEAGSLFPVGYMRHGGKRLSKGWTNAGGFISFRNGTLELTPVRSGTPKGNFDVLQSKPLMIEPGKRWAMRTNRENVKYRTILCTKEIGEILIAVISRGGMSLFEAGWLMRSPDVGGFFDCSSAIALDGGRSTQMWGCRKTGMEF